MQYPFQNIIMKTTFNILCFLTRFCLNLLFFYFKTASVNLEFILSKRIPRDRGSLGSKIYFLAGKELMCAYLIQEEKKKKSV